MPDKRSTIHALITMAFIVVSTTALLGCGTFPVVATNVLQPGKKVSAEASQFSFLWLMPLPTETPGKLIDTLLYDCDGTGLTGLTLTTTVAFAGLGQVERMRVSAYCIDPSEA